MDSEKKSGSTLLIEEVLEGSKKIGEELDQIKTGIERIQEKIKEMERIAKGSQG